MKGHKLMPETIDLSRHYDAEDEDESRYHQAKFVAEIRNWLGMSASGGCGVTYDY
jgi:hypothetical protein